MRIKMLVSVAGVNFSLSPNDETDQFCKDEAKRLIDAGFAVPVSDVKIEKKVKPNPREIR